MKYLFQTVSLFILKIKTNSNLIVIPFINKEISGEDNHQYIYTQIEIGDPPQNRFITKFSRFVFLYIQYHKFKHEFKFLI